MRCKHEYWKLCIMKEIHQEIAEYLKFCQSNGTLILFKNENEREFLFSWLSQKKADCKSAPSLSHLISQIGMCTLCGNTLRKKRNFGTGENGIMVIINTPRLISTEEKQKLKNEAFALMNKMLIAIEIVPEKCYITNMIKCDAEIEAIPSTMYKNCAKFLEQEFKIISPHTVIVMGHILPLKKLIDSSKNTKWFNIEHPLTILKNTELKKGAWATLKEVKKHIGNIKGIR